MRTISGLLVMVVMAGSATLWAAGGVLPGGGTEGNPYLIEDLADFDVFAGDPNYWDDYTRLETDVDLDGRPPYTTAVIAPNTGNTNYLFEGTPFTGVFNGDGHCVVNMTIAGDNYLGLFGMVETGGIIRDLGVEDAEITGTYEARYLGGVAGVSRGTILRCHSTGSVHGDAIWSWPIEPPDSDHIGGLAGDNDEGVITDCYSTCSVKGNARVGGLVGVSRGPITNSHATGSISGNSGSMQVGGLVGLNRDLIDNCFATGSVTGRYNSRNFGGLAGDNLEGIIANSHATGSVSDGGSYGPTGGLTAVNAGEIRNCYATGSVSGDYGIGGLVGVNHGSIASSGAESTVVCSDMYGGGLVGLNSEGTVVDSYAICFVSGEEEGRDIGGLVGRHHSLDGIVNCYAAGEISGGEVVGGVVGVSYGLIRNCFWDVGTSGLTNMCGEESGGGTDCDDSCGKTTIEMKRQSSFVGWDFVGEDVNGVEYVWRMCVDEVDYPRLSWEYSLVGDFDCGDGVGIEDLVYLAGRWLMEDGAAGAADADGDGRVDMRDFGVMSGGWGEGGE